MGFNQGHLQEKDNKDNKYKANSVPGWKLSICLLELHLFLFPAELQGDVLGRGLTRISFNSLDGSQNIKALKGKIKGSNCHPRKLQGFYRPSTLPSCSLLQFSRPYGVKFHHRKEQSLISSGHGYSSEKGMDRVSFTFMLKIAFKIKRAFQSNLWCGERESFIVCIWEPFPWRGPYFIMLT